MIRYLKKVYCSQMSTPTYLGLFFNPFYFSRRSIYVAMADMASKIHGRMVDVGYGGQPYRNLFTVDEYCGVELDTELNRKTKKADIYYDGVSLPFESDRFDALLCNQVLEHVQDEDPFVAELARVLRPGGAMILSAPFLWDEHEQPFDFKRYTSYGMQSLLERHGFSIIKLQKTCSDASMISKLLTCMYSRYSCQRMSICNYY